MRTKTVEQADKILSVAVRLFATHRFHEARMEDIAAAAGVGKGTLYRYFKDKEELYLALLEQSSDQYTQLMKQAVESHTNPRQKLEALTATIIAYFDENPYVFDLIQHAEALHKPHQEFPWRARAVSIDLTKEVIAEGQKAGVFRGSDATLTTLLLLGGLRAVFRFGEKPRAADLPQHIVEVFLQDVIEVAPGVHSSAANGHRQKKHAAH